MQCRFIVNPKSRRRFSFVRFPLEWLGVLLTALALFSGCSDRASSGSAGKSGPKEGAPVTVATVVRKTVPVQVRAVGNVQAYTTVSVKSQVAGEITRVYFQEGQDVKKGDMLFTIDPRPFEATLRQAEANLAKDTAQLKQAEANLARDMAQAKNAEVEARRYGDLIEQGIVAREQYDQMRTNSEALAASVRADRAAIENTQAAMQADRAAVENAKIQLGYCSIRAQIDGRTGSLLVHPGNVVKINDTTPLVVINQINPIYVSFSVPEQILPEIKRYMASGKLKVDSLLDSGGKSNPQGELTFVDNTVDMATGTIHLKATFANREKTLWPGQFVNVVLTLTMRPNAIVVPSQAVQAGQQGQYVFVVKPDLTVESRPVAVKTVGADTVVEKGLEAGEKVVTDGQLRLFPGAKVEIKTDRAATPPEENAR